MRVRNVLIAAHSRLFYSIRNWLKIGILPANFSEMKRTLYRVETDVDLYREHKKVANELRRYIAGFETAVARDNRRGAHTILRKMRQTLVDIQALADENTPEDSLEFVPAEYEEKRSWE